MKRIKNNFPVKPTSTYFLTIVFGIFMLFASQWAVAQEHWRLEFRPGVAFPTQEMGGADLGTGFGFEGTIAYRFMPHLAGYAGWGWHQFSADQSFAGTDINFEETGYTFGLQFIHPIGTSKLNYLVRAGAVLNHIEAENNDGDIIADSGHGLGWQLGAGLDIPISDRWQLTPSVQYRSLSREIEVDEATTDIDLNYLSLGIGVSWSF